MGNSITYTGADYIGYGCNAGLPAAPAGYKYLFKANGSDRTGKGITSGVTATVTKCRQTELLPSVIAIENGKLVYDVL